jgi:hypothetical protein
MPDNESDCEATTVTAKVYTRSGSSGAWTARSNTAQTGVWSGGACTNLSIYSNPSGNAAEELVIGQVREVHSGGSFIAAFNKRASISGWSPVLN